MADPASARRRAEEALSRVLARAATIIRLSWSDGATAADRRNLERIKSAAADIAQDHKILRALLAALPAEGAAESCEWGPCPAYRDGGPHAGCDLCGGFGALPSEADLATAPQPALTLTRDEAVAAGLPIHPEAVGVKVYSGAWVSQPDAVREAAELAHLDLLSYDEAVTGNEKRHALSRCKNALRDVLRTIDAAARAAKGGE